MKFKIMPRKKSIKKDEKAVKQTESKKSTKKAKKKAPIVKKDKRNNITMNLTPLYLPLAIIFAGILIAISVVVAFGDIDALRATRYECDELDPLGKGCLIESAKEVGLNESSFTKCLDNEDFNDDIQDDIDYASSLDIQGTPHMIIGKLENGTLKGFYAGGAQGYDYYKSLIDDVAENDLETVKDNLIDERYGDYDELVASVKDSYKEQGIPEDQLEQYATAAIENELAKYEIQEYNYENGSRIGNEDAEIVLMAFSDFECPYCKLFAQDTLPQIEEDYIANGTVQFIFRDYPIESSHPKARRAANAARCAADKGEFSEYHDLLFEVNEGGSDTQETTDGVE